jgi:hypothetical protein
VGRGSITLVVPGLAIGDRQREIGSSLSLSRFAVFAAMGWDESFSSSSACAKLDLSLNLLLLLLHLYIQFLSLFVAAAAAVVTIGEERTPLLNEAKGKEVGFFHGG